MPIWFCCLGWRLEWDEAQPGSRLQYMQRLWGSCRKLFMVDQMLVFGFAGSQVLRPKRNKTWKACLTD